jgi:hypothetical protein
VHRLSWDGLERHQSSRAIGTFLVGSLRTTSIRRSELVVLSAAICGQDTMLPPSSVQCAAEDSAYVIHVLGSMHYPCPPPHKTGVVSASQPLTNTNVRSVPGRSFGRHSHSELSGQYWLKKRVARAGSIPEKAQGTSTILYPTPDPGTP